jgi:hypothetical protein
MVELLVILNVVKNLSLVYTYILYLRNEFSSSGFSSIGSLTLRAVALGQGKARFLGGIP